MARLTAGQTLRVRGEGGVEFDLDVPTDPTRREIFDYQVNTGSLSVLGLVADGDLVEGEPGYDPDEPEGDEVESITDDGDEPDGDEVPDGTNAAVLAWVGDDLERAARALAAEVDGKQRKRLIASLEAVLADAPTPEPDDDDDVDPEVDRGEHAAA